MKLELILPGSQPKEPGIRSLPKGYRITVERTDGLGCSEIEADTALRAFLENKYSSVVAPK